MRWTGEVADEVRVFTQNSYFNCTPSRHAVARANRDIVLTVDALGASLVIGSGLDRLERVELNREPTWFDGDCVVRAVEQVIGLYGAAKKHRVFQPWAEKVDQPAVVGDDNRYKIGSALALGGELRSIELLQFVELEACDRLGAVELRVTDAVEDRIGPPAVSEIKYQAIQRVCRVVASDPD